MPGTRPCAPRIRANRWRTMIEGRTRHPTSRGGGCRPRENSCHQAGRVRVTMASSPSVPGRHHAFETGGLGRLQSPPAMTRVEYLASSPTEAQLFGYLRHLYVDSDCVSGCGHSVFVRAFFDA